MTGNEKANTKNNTSITFTTSTLWGPRSVPRLSIHNPVISKMHAGIRRMNRVKNTRKVLLGDAWMNLAKAPNCGCFCHRVPSWTIQKMKNMMSIIMNGIRNICNHIAVGLPMRIFQKPAHSTYKRYGQCTFRDDLSKLLSHESCLSWDEDCSDSTWDLSLLDEIVSSAVIQTRSRGGGSIWLSLVTGCLACCFDMSIDFSFFSMLLTGFKLSFEAVTMLWM